MKRTLPCETRLSSETIQIKIDGETYLTEEICRGVPRSLGREGVEASDLPLKPHRFVLAREFYLLPGTEDDHDEDDEEKHRGVEDDLFEEHVLHWF